MHYVYLNNRLHAVYGVQFTQGSGIRNWPRLIVCNLTVICVFGTQWIELPLITVAWYQQTNCGSGKISRRLTVNSDVTPKSECVLVSRISNFADLSCILVSETRVIGLHLRRWQYRSIFIQIFTVSQGLRKPLFCVLKDELFMPEDELSWADRQK